MNGECSICHQTALPLAFHQGHRDKDKICGQCNLGLTSFNDDPVRLQAAIRYLLGSEYEVVTEFGGHEFPVPVPSDDSLALAVRRLLLNCPSCDSGFHDTRPGGCTDEWHGVA